MPEQPYKRPPITEAVIQIGFAGTLSSNELRRADEIFARFYAHHQDVRNLNVAFEVSNQAGIDPETQVRDQEEGHRRSSDDQTQLVVLWQSSLVVSQLAPYPGWDKFFGRFDRDWKIWKKVIGYRKINRVGVRYINRIDIPITGEIIEFQKYIKIIPQYPDEFGPNLAYSVFVKIPIDILSCSLTINSSSVPSPLLQHASYVFDQDIVREVDFPQNDTDLYKLLADIHLKKNEVFEACITDRARELFKK